MSNVTNVGKRVKHFQSSPQFDGFTGVVLTVTEELEYAAGTGTGRILRLTCPWGTQQMADNILASIRGFQYQPYQAEGAVIDPAVELGDGIYINDLYSGVYSSSLTFGSKLIATVQAPEDEEIDHEYPYVPKQERRVTRTLRQMTAELRVQADLISAEVADRKSETEKVLAQLSVQSNQIAAKVERTGGNSSSFGWVLNDSSWTIKAKNTDILRATSDGLEVYGKVTATSGKIGGFSITADSLSFNNQAWGGTNSVGIYIGPNGIQLGRNFKVDQAGNLTATSGTFTGSVQAGNIQYGGSNGTLSGSALTSHSVTGSQIGYNSITTAYTSGGINASLSYADFANGVFNGWNTAPTVQCAKLMCSGVATMKDMMFDGKRVERVSKTVSTPGGGSITINYLEWVN